MNVADIKREEAEAACCSNPSAATRTAFYRARREQLQAENLEGLRLAWQRLISPSGLLQLAALGACLLLLRVL